MKFFCLRSFWFLSSLFFLLFPFAVFPIENNDDSFPSYPLFLREELKEDITFFAPDQLATLTTDANQLIGGLISPLSGNPYIRQLDFTVTGAQPLSLSHIYVAPYMPDSFHKKEDVDHFSRSYYMRRCYEGWKFFPHIYLIHYQENKVRVIYPNAASYDYDISQTKPVLLHSFGMSNLDENEMPSGKCNPKNTRIIRQGNKITVFSMDGFTRFYHHATNTTSYLLRKEILPNGKVNRYHYNEKWQLSKVESLDPKERVMSIPQ